MSKKPAPKAAPPAAPAPDIDEDHELLMAVARAVRHISPEVKAILAAKEKG